MKLYRYERNQVDSTKLNLIEFEVKKETKCGYWLKDYGKTWVGKTGKKRYAYPTKTEALFNFKKRKEREILILKSRLECSELLLKKANKQLLPY